MDSRTFVLLRRRAVERRAARRLETVATSRAQMAIFRAALARWPGNSGDQQRSRLLAVLRRTTLTTYEARRWLDLPNPSQRVGELREDYPHIVADRVQQPMHTGGTLHEVAQYRLVHEDRGVS